MMQADMNDTKKLNEEDLRIDMDVVRERRKELKLSRRQICEKLNISEETLKMWEEKKRTPIAGEVLYKILHFLDLSLYDVINVENKPFSQEGNRKTRKVTDLTKQEKAFLIQCLEEAAPFLTKEELPVLEGLIKRLKQLSE